MQAIEGKPGEGEGKGNLFFQLKGELILTQVKSGLMAIHRQRALERIYFEDCLRSLESGKGLSQQQLFPQTIQLSAGDAEILKGLLPELQLLGFNLEDFGNSAYIINGSPAELNNEDVKDVLDNIIENVKNNIGEIKIDKKVGLARSMAVNMAFRHTANLKTEEIKSLIDRLFATKVPEASPDGKPVVRIITFDEIRDKF
jgi:DNA mismatch repair protein MutL